PLVACLCPYTTLFRSISVRSNAQSESEAEMETLNAFEQMTIGLGLEYWYKNLFALRGGYFYENPYNGNRKFLTFGSGIRWNIIGDRKSTRLNSSHVKS